eukprot:XP_015573199.1 uncharacterized protein LOC107261065 [Ricinus communis]
MALVRKCHECQVYNNLNHLPPIKLHNLTSPWPFAAWRIGIIGEIKPLLNGHRYIVIAIDYFSKWVEASSFTTIGIKQMAKSVEWNLICRYRFSYHIVTDNVIQFIGETMDLLEEYKIKHHRSFSYKNQVNGTVEATNKNLKKIL